MMLFEKCESCEQVFKIGDKIYEERYFFRGYCCWDCLVKGMSEFFDVEKGKTITFGQDDDS